jgi:hypothetical protein
MFVLASACLEQADDPEAAVEQAIGGGEDTCQTWQCGANSPLIENFGFHDMGLPTTFGTPGPANNAGIQILVFVKYTGSTVGYYMPRVLKGKLSAFPVSSTPPVNVTLTGQALVGGYFWLITPLGYYKLFIDEVGSVKSWAQPPGTPPNQPSVFLETYRLNWASFANVETRTNVCSNPGERDDMGMTGKLSFHSLLFEGDQIDAGHKWVTGVDTQWFNIGCAGSALAKMALTGHTEASRLALTFNTSLSERQTMLKMLTADYCGLGKPFTVPHQPLNWADDHGTMFMIAPAASPPRPVFREARWNRNGAVCLDLPRVDSYWTPLGESLLLSGGLSVYQQVQAFCGARMPPPCTGSPLGNDGYHLVTATEHFAQP